MESPIPPKLFQSLKSDASRSNVTFKGRELILVPRSSDHELFQTNQMQVDLVAETNPRVRRTGKDGDAGEGRFVYCLFNPKTGLPFTGGDAFLVIFEFGVRFKTFDDVQAYGKKWAELSCQPFDALVKTNPPCEDRFNQQLQIITDQFTELNQLRPTNGIWAISGSSASFG